jgi:hypothetical protein
MALSSGRTNKINTCLFSLLGKGPQDNGSKKNAVAGI